MSNIIDFPTPTTNDLIPQEYSSNLLDHICLELLIKMHKAEKELLTNNKQLPEAEAKLFIALQQYVNTSEGFGNNNTPDPF